MRSLSLAPRTEEDSAQVILDEVWKGEREGMRSLTGSLSVILEWIVVVV